MISALIVGELHTNPKLRTARNGNAFAIACVSVPMGDEGRILCSVICFDSHAGERLLQLKPGALVAMMGMLKVGTWTANNRTVKPSLNMVAYEVAATTPRPKKPKAESPQHGQQYGGDFDDLPGADDLGGQY